MKVYVLVDISDTYWTADEDEADAEKMIIGVFLDEHAARAKCVSIRRDIRIVERELDQMDKVP